MKTARYGKNIRGLRPAGRTRRLRTLDAFRQTVGHHFYNPPETAVVIDDYLHVTAPGIVTLSRKSDPLINAHKNGYE